MQRRVAVRAIIIDEGKLFCVRQLHYQNGVAQAEDWWCTPGGGVDPKEPLLEALRREMLEETGIAPVIGPLLYVQQYADSDREYLEFFFHVTNTEDYKKINLATTTHGQQEIAEFAFIDPAGDIYPKFLRTDLPPDGAVQPTRFYTYGLTDN